MKIVNILLLTLIMLFVGACNTKEMYEENYEVTEDVQATMTRLKAERDQFEELFQAARVLNGELIAAARISVPAETVYVKLADATTTAEDGHRYAERTDTLPGGYIVQQEAHAPPYPDNLRLGATVIIPPFEPEIGFVRSGPRDYHAIVRWGDKEFTIQNAFHIPHLRNQPSSRKWGPVVGVYRFWHKQPGENTLAERSLYAGLRYNLIKGLDVRWEAGLVGEKYWGIRAEYKF